MKNILDLKHKCEKIISMGWIKCIKRGNSAAGLLFEELVGVPTNNFEIADYDGIEIKTKISKRENYISLFCATPDSYLFEIKRIYETYAYYDRYNMFKSFNITTYANRKVYMGDNKFCKLKVDYKNNKIVLLIINNIGEVVDDKISWSFDMVKEKLERKFKYLLLINGDRKFEIGEIFYKFTKYKFYSLKKFENFLDALERGYIRISFTIGTFKSGKKAGQIHDHGTCFNIHKDYINYIFDEMSF